MYTIIFGLMLFVSSIHSLSNPIDDGEDNDNQNQELFTYSQRLFQQQVLRTHNKYRSRHCSPPLRLDNDLNRQAQLQAERLANSNGKVQSNLNNVGQNLYMKSSSLYLDYVTGK